MGMWVTTEDRTQFETYCNEQDDASSCLDSIRMITTAGVTYCDASCWAAVEDIQAYHDRWDVCPMWEADHRLGMEGPMDGFDCPQLEDVTDNLEEFPLRADPAGKCQAC